jgi:Uma2 family endonuclease
MATLLKLGPTDQGRTLTLEDFLAAEYQEGYHYELIDGRLDVSPGPNAPEKILETWVLFKLYAYQQSHPEVFNYSCFGPRVFVPDRADVTAPEPDVGAYREFPLDEDYREINWRDHSPLLVVEVLSENHPNKDLVRNAELYHQVPSIKEYWVVDGRPDPNRPTLIVHRRHGKRWRITQVPFGASYITKLLPDFELIIDPRR